MAQSQPEAPVSWQDKVDRVLTLMRDRGELSMKSLVNLYCVSRGCRQLLENPEHGDETANLRGLGPFSYRMGLVCVRLEERKVRINEMSGNLSRLGAALHKNAFWWGDWMRRFLERNQEVYSGGKAGRDCDAKGWLRMACREPFGSDVRRLADGMRWCLGTDTGVLAHGESLGVYRGIGTATFVEDDDNTGAEEITCLAVHGTTVVTLDNACTMKQWDISSGSPVETHTLEDEGEALSVCFHNSGRLIAATGNGEVWVYQVGAGSGQRETLMRFDAGFFNLIASSADGQTLACASRCSSGGFGTGGKVVLMRAISRDQWKEDGVEVCGTLLHDDGIHSMTLNHNGSLVVTGGEGGWIRVWGSNARGAWHVSNKVRGHEGGAMSVTFAPNEETLASTYLDGTIIVWDVSTWTQKCVLKGHRYPRVTYNHDGTLLAAGGDDLSILVWDMTTQPPALKERLVGHTNCAGSVGFNNGSLLVSGGGDETLKVWDMAEPDDTAHHDGMDMDT
eukprot:CAMPEP_0173436404 /NCGR_PEP_ID=MMETSP1357-20121228/16035_1 /TAXON_ID=77926 /ORGANISM="Hemiselmis rufescens, Strain PCC563" /LENGTH=505 /DNA_ID=CAMNT_0014401479 /DNA_START=74 /DNA_END=1591 /DNA_ORIENTATION=+